MKALTAHQPWAWAIAHAGKDVDNRSTLFRYRGPLAIHAGMQYREHADDWITGHTDLVPPTEGHLVYGAVIAVCELVDVVDRRDRQRRSRGDSVWAMPGFVHLHLERIRPLAEPIPYKGQQGMWDLPFDPGE